MCGVVISPALVRARLGVWDADRLTARLGLRPDDAAGTEVLVREVHDDAAATAAVVELAAELVGVVGALDPGRPEALRQGRTPHDYDSAALGRVPGGLALLALLVTTPEVLAFHRQHGIAEPQSWRTLSDLGQQMGVHRRTHGGLGLHTQRWLTTAWSGAVHWLGRLQLELRPVVVAGTSDPVRWQLSAHIPESGPLTPVAVQESFVAGERFFAAHHPERPVTELHCSSWLLDPALAEHLPGSNLAAFQQRWQLTGERYPGTEDALFFTFRARPGVDGRPIDLDTLPTDTTLQRLVLARIRGDGWWTTEGVAPLPSQAAGSGRPS